MAVKDRFIIAGGCSFTAHLDRDQLSWANQMMESNEYNMINTAEMASGNQIIFDRIAAQLSMPEVMERNPVVVVMWSSPLRKEFLISHDDPDFRKLYNDREQGFTNYIRQGTEAWEGNRKNPLSNWLIVGGGYGVWKYDIPTLDTNLENYYNGVYNIAQCYVDTCRAMVGLQTLCKSLDVPLVNMCWMNIFHDLHEWGGRPDRNLVGVNSGWGWIARKFHDQYLKKKQENVENQDFHNKAIWRMYPDCKHWYDLIDWDTWFFYENEKIKKGGLQEYSYYECGTEVEHLWNHPSTEIQQKWKYKVIAELRRRGLI